MNWDAIGAIGEIIGALAVVLTLIYLSRQIKENSRHLKLASLTDTNLLVSEGFNPIYNSDHTLFIWTVGLSEPEKLEKADLEIFYLFMTRIMASFDTVVKHHELGTIDDERFANYVNFARSFLDSAGGEKWLEEKSYEFSSAAKKVLHGSNEGSA